MRLHAPDISIYLDLVLDLLQLLLKLIELVVGFRLQGQQQTHSP
jgi:hypothetical protein